MAHSVMSGSHAADGWTNPPVTSFCHEALFYEGDDDLMNATERFVREGLAVDDGILVVLSGSKLDSLRGTLGALQKSSSPTWTSWVPTPHA